MACELDKSTPKGAPKQYIHDQVTSGDLEWIPQGEQETAFGDRIPGPTNPVCATMLRESVTSATHPGWPEHCPGKNAARTRNRVGAACS